MAAAAAPEEPDLRTLDQVCDDHIKHVMKVVDGNKAKAARILGIDRRTLYRYYESRLPASSDR